MIWCTILCYTMANVKWRSIERMSIFFVTWFTIKKKFCNYVPFCSQQSRLYLIWTLHTAKEQETFLRIIWSPFKKKNTNIHRTKKGESRSDIYPACLIPGMLNYIYFLKKKGWFVEIQHCKLTISEWSITDDKS